VVSWFARERNAFVECNVIIIRDMPRLRRLAQGREPIETRRTKQTSNPMPERVS
jgi:hypothetical protein